MPQDLPDWAEPAAPPRRDRPFDRTDSNESSPPPSDALSWPETGDPAEPQVWPAPGEDRHKPPSLAMTNNLGSELDRLPLYVQGEGDAPYRLQITKMSANEWRIIYKAVDGDRTVLRCYNNNLTELARDVWDKLKQGGYC